MSVVGVGVAAVIVIVAAIVWLATSRQGVPGFSIAQAELPAPTTSVTSVPTTTTVVTGVPIVALTSVPATSTNVGTDVSTASPSPVPATSTSTSAAPTLTPTPVPTDTPQPPTVQPTRSIPPVEAAMARVNAEGYSPQGPDPASYDRFSLRVLLGVRTGSADGYDQRAFFFFGDEYLGTDTFAPSAGITLASQDESTVSLQYALYRPNDAMCCPSGGAAVVRFHWDGNRLTPLDIIPPDGAQATVSRR